MPTHHVYADANIFLDFFRFSDDDLGELEKLATHIADGNVVLYLPQLTAEEYFRNRDKVVLEQLQELRKHPLKVGIPIFIRELDKAKDFQEKLRDALAARTLFLEEVEAQAAARTFRADELIAQIFSKARGMITTGQLLDRARARLSLGNPPGKPGSLGDRLNWESLLEDVPQHNDLYLLTRDTDYIASFPSATPNMFLVNEWKNEKKGEIRLFKGIKAFAKLVDETIVFKSDDGPVFVKDPNRSAAIDELLCSFSYAQTHAAIGGLNQYIDQFSPDELETLLEIAMNNSQVGGVLGDDDVEEFYSKVRSKMPWIGNAVADKFDEIFGVLSDVPF